MTDPTPGPETRLDLVVDGQARSAVVDTSMVLVEALRERFGALGPKQGCLTGDCGACTVRIDGRTRKACLELAVAADGSTIDTIEGLAGDDSLSPLQAAFAACGGFQCGFCLSGMLFAADDLLQTTPQPTETEVRQALRGNLCRCTGYTPIVDSVLAAAAAGDDSSPKQR